MELETLKLLAHAMSTDKTRECLMGIYIDHEKERFVATDGHRLVYTVGIPMTHRMAEINDLNFIPMESVKAMLKHKEFSTAVDTLSKNENFPLYELVLPQECTLVEALNFNSGVNLQYFIQDLKRIKGMTDNMSKGIVLEFIPDKPLTLRHETSTSVASINTQIEHNLDKVYQIMLNPQYLLDALRPHKSTYYAVHFSVQLEYNVGPLVIDTCATKEVIMPMRLDLHRYEVKGK